MKNLGSVQDTILSEGWYEIKRQIAERLTAAVIQLATVGRPQTPSDDALRGVISAHQWVLDFEKRVALATREAIADKEEQAAEAEGVGSPMEAEPEASTT